VTHKTLALLVILAACRREEVPVAPAVHAQDAVVIQAVAQPKPLPAPLPEPVTAVQAPEPVTETWAQLPDEWTRTAGKSPLRRGDRLIVGNNDGLFELTWWGKPKKQLSTHAVRAVRWWDERTLVFVDEAFVVRKFDLAMGDEHRVAVLPTEGRCRGWRWERETFYAVRLDLDREADRLCATLVGPRWCAGVPATVRRQGDETGVAVGLASQSVRRICDGTCVETGSLELIPTLDQAEEPGDSHVPVETNANATFVFQLDRKNRGRVARISRDGTARTVTRLEPPPPAFGYTWTADEPSPSGRWQALLGISDSGSGCPPRSIVVLDRQRGTLHPVTVGAWQTTPSIDGRTDPLTITANLAPGEEHSRWLPHSDVLLVGGLVLIPGVGAFRPGVVAY
jgi:hypothetical protein